MKKVYKKEIGITGANGVLGNYFIKKNKNNYTFKEYNKKIEDIAEFKNWLKKNKNIEIFLHLAAITKIKLAKKNKKKTFLINSESTIKILNVFNSLENKKLKYFLFASSSHVYAPSFNKINEKSKRIPINTYGESKKIVEDYIFKNNKKFYFKIGIARIFNFYSKEQTEGFFIFDIIKRIKRKKNLLKFKKVNTNRDYIPLKDLSNIIKFMILKRIDRPINIGTGKKLNLIKLIKKIKLLYNKNLKIIFEKKKYPGYVSNISLLRKLGYKNKISIFKLI